MLTTCKVFSRLLVAVTALMLLAACGGSGGSVESTTNTDDGSTGGSVPESGSLTLLVTDAETDRFNEILVTINQAILIPADDAGELQQQTVLDESITIDLRALEDFSEILVETEVDAGEYSKLRLMVDDIELNEVDDNGNLVDAKTAKVPSNKIDLTPRGPFSIEGGGDEVVLIDFDADNSFKIVQTGAGMVIFRPVVFINVLGDDSDSGRLLRLFGQITTPDAEASTFELCGLDMQSAGDTDVVDADDCASVEYDAETRVFSDELAAVTTEDLIENANATVFGRVNRGPDGVLVTALLVALGDDEVLTSIEGEVTSEAVDGSFELTPLPSEELDAVQTITVPDGALLFERDGAELIALEAIEVGRDATVIGASDAELEDQFNAIVVSLAPDESETEAVEGTITAVDGDTLTVSVDQDGMTTDRCVTFNAETEIQVSTTADDGTEVSEGAESDLVVDAEVDAQGTLDESECVVADLIIVDQTDDESGDSTAS